FFEPFNFLDIQLKEVRHRVLSKVQMIVCGIVLCCGTMSATYHRLKDEHVVAETLQMESFPDNTSLSRLFKVIRAEDVEDVNAIWRYQLSEHGLAANSEGIVLFDIDPTGLVVTTKDGRFEWVEKGYFAKNPGAVGYQVCLGVASNMNHEVLSQTLDPGNTDTTDRFYTLTYEAADVLGGFERLFLRADAQFGVGHIVTFAIDHRVAGWLIKGRDPRTARTIAGRLAQQLAWVYVDNNVWVAEASFQRVPGCETPVRVVLIRTYSIKKRRHKFTYLTTSLMASECDARDLFHFYNGRVTIEKLIERAKNVLRLRHLPTGKFQGLCFFMHLFWLTFNLVVWYHYHVLGNSELLGKTAVPEFLKGISTLSVVTERTEAGITFFVARAHSWARHVLQATQAWLRANMTIIRLGNLVHVHYTRAQLLANIWRRSLFKRGYSVPEAVML
ncbi:MAG: transposase, partial [Chloroflexi bacterium]|nr:transposase [Chloroflexota bacterium]